MKKFITYLVIASSSAYYAFLPFVVAKAQAPAVTGQIATSTVRYMRVSAYASVQDETDDTPFITADGSHVYYGEVASNILPFGTKIEIPALFGTKVFTVEDRMSTKIKNTIDIWMPSVKQALVFGASHANIVVLGTSTPELADAR